jgi:hypothetical protein
MNVFLIGLASFAIVIIPVVLLAFSGEEPRDEV